MTASTTVIPAGATITVNVPGGQDQVILWSDLTAELATFEVGEVIVLAAGTAAAPAVGWTDTGFFEAIANRIGITISAVQRWYISASEFTSNTASGPFLRQAAGSATVPSYAYNGNTNTGTGRAAANAANHIAGGVEAVRYTGDLTDVILAHEANVGLTADVGSAQGNGVITSSINVYSTVGTAGDAATLPAVFTAGNPSTVIYIKNDAAVNSMDVFPASGDDAGAGTNVAVAVAAGDFAVFIATVADATWTKLQGGTA